MILYKLADAYEVELLKPIFTENALSYDINTLKQFIKEPTCQLYIALDDDRVIGYAYAYLQLHPDGKIMQHIYNLFVAKSHRRQGIASEFLSFILEDAYQIGCHESWMSADPLNGAVRRLMSKLKHEPLEQRIFRFNYRDRS